ncbi:MAG: hypothetical protein ABIH72_00065 [archaeon]
MARSGFNSDSFEFLNDLPNLDDPNYDPEDEPVEPPQLLHGFQVYSLNEDKRQPISPRYYNQLVSSIASMGRPPVIPKMPRKSQFENFSGVLFNPRSPDYTKRDFSDKDLEPITLHSTPESGELFQRHPIGGLESMSRPVLSVRQRFPYI